MNQSAPAVLHTPGFAHSNISWSPFHNTRIAVASSANYGIIGNGRLFIASASSGPSGAAGVRPDKLSVCWSFHPAAELMLKFFFFQL